MVVAVEMGDFVVVKEVAIAAVEEDGRFPFYDKSDNGAEEVGSDELSSGGGISCGQKGEYVLQVVGAGGVEVGEEGFVGFVVGEMGREVNGRQLSQQLGADFIVRRVRTAFITVFAAAAIENEAKGAMWCGCAGDGEIVAVLLHEAVGTADCGSVTYHGVVVYWYNSVFVTRCILVYKIHFVNPVDH